MSELTEQERIAIENVRRMANRLAREDGMDIFSQSLRIVCGLVERLAESEGAHR